MIGQVLKKTFEIYTFPARFMYSFTLDQVDKVRNIADDIKQLKHELSLAELEVKDTLDRIFSQVEQDLQQDYGNLADEKVRDNAITQSLLKTDHLLSQAAVELLKSLFLLLNPTGKKLGTAQKQQISGNVIEGELVGR